VRDDARWLRAPKKSAASLPTSPSPSLDKLPVQRRIALSTPTYLRMPRIKSFAPSWLNPPAPGHKLFAPPSDEGKPAALAYGRKAKPGRRQTIAKRGTEVFVASGKQIRWGDLVYLKEKWESKQNGGRIRREDSHASFEVYDEESSGASGPAEGYRVRAGALSSSALS
jgi:hypothetical protein